MSSQHTLKVFNASNSISAKLADYLDTRKIELTHVLNYKSGWVKMEKSYITNDEILIYAGRTSKGQVFFRKNIIKGTTTEPTLMYLGKFID